MGHRVYGVLRPRTTLILLVDLAIAVALFYVGVFLPQMEAFEASLRNSQTDDRMLDTRFGGYEIGGVRAFLTGIGEQNRAGYSRTLLGADLIFPWVYGAWLALLLGLAYRRVWRWQRQVWLLLLPLGVVAFDYAENLTIAWYLIPNYDSLPAAAVYWASAFTVAKFAFIGASILAVLISLALTRRAP
jgi:hypothetical protein